MESPIEARAWLRCYRCWSTNLEVQVHYEGIHRIDPDTGERADVVDELQEAVVQCLDCMHDQPHLAFAGGRVEPIEDRWERMIAGTPWVASCTVQVDVDEVETCYGVTPRWVDEEEIEAAHAFLGSAPAVVGFYSYGEISPHLGTSELHNQTMTLTTLTERPDA